MNALADHCRRWFDGYVSGYFSGDADADYNLRLKYEHCGRVRDNAREILDSLEVDPRLDDLTETAALLHDVGRFEQYRRFRTFDDRRSLSHGRLGSDVLRASGLLSDLPARDRGTILGAVFLHNRMTVPASCVPETAFAARVVRDADKLDIFPVMLAHFDPSRPRNDVVVLHLKDEPDRYSPEMAESVASGRLARYSRMVYVNDFKLLLLSWAFDLNFAASRRRIVGSGYVEQLESGLPRDVVLSGALAKVREVLNI